MHATIAYNTVVGLLANPTSLGSRPNFFNLRELRLHYARALKNPCPQSAVNGWSGAVLLPAMYALINMRRFTVNITTSPIPVFPPRFVGNNDGTDGPEIQILTITATHGRNKHYNNTGINVCRAIFDSLETHIGDEFKSSPTNAPGTTGWNSTMLPNDMFDQLILTYSKPTPNAVRQNNVTFYSANNPKDPPEVLLKHFAYCQEIAIISKVPFTTEQLLMNAVDLFTRSDLYTRDMDDFNLRPFIQAAYQRTSHHIRLYHCGCLWLQFGYRFAGLTAEGDVSNNGIAETIT
jgi:hypothetical protein